MKITMVNKIYLICVEDASNTTQFDRFYTRCRAEDQKENDQE